MHFHSLRFRRPIVRWPAGIVPNLVSWGRVGPCRTNKEHKQQLKCDFNLLERARGTYKKMISLHFLFVHCVRHPISDLPFNWCNGSRSWTQRHRLRTVFFSYFFSFSPFCFASAFQLRPEHKSKRYNNYLEYISGHVMCNNTCSSQALQNSQCATATRFFFIAICLRKCDVVTCITKQRRDQQTSLSKTEIIVGINGKN